MPASSYDQRTDRFFRTYQQFKPEQDHELVIVDCGGDGPRGIGDTPIFHQMIPYYGHGWDCGAYQFAANALDCDLLVCCNAGVFFHTSNKWLYPLVAARRHYGPGIYGVSASFERHPHIRTPCFAIAPELLREYPIAVHDRETCNQFEASSKSITAFVEGLGKPALLMSWDAASEKKDWRVGQNIFRRGDQSNVMVHDRHTEIYGQSTPAQRAELERYANAG